MTVRIRECRLRVGHTKEELEQKICRLLRVKHTPPYEIRLRSVDARRKPDLFYVYTIDVKVTDPKETVKRAGNRHVTACDEIKYRFPYERCARSDPDPPVIIGSGPAGLFCALMLARAGLCPIVLERGERVEERQKRVDHFWKSGELNPESNVQFGEGGAGTFSDGKLNTSIRDPKGQIRFVLREFVKAGAPEEILVEQKPHIGTDVLKTIVSHIRFEILALGGELRFHSCLTGICAGENSKGYLLEINHGEESLAASSLILATGHSARDTTAMLYDRGLAMEAKSFAVGLRAQHPQVWINRAMYGLEDQKELGAASYKLTAKSAAGRGVYTFCMCPGGTVINASSEPSRLAVNGMSDAARDGKNANSAIVVTVTPKDYGSDHPLAGLAFQENLERRAFACARGKIPVQRFEDYCLNRPSLSHGGIKPDTKGAWEMTNLRGILPAECEEALIEGMHDFGKKIPDFDAPSVLLFGVESRTSSPVRMLRDETFQSKSAPGIFPCGEGAGYAGGIVSAAVDGIRVAEAVCAFYKGDF